VRVLPIASVALSLGCGLSASYGATGDGTPDAQDARREPEASDLDASLDAQPEPPLSWTSVDEDIFQGDIVSVWGSSSTDVSVGTDSFAVVRIASGIAAPTVFPDQVAGAGWGSDPQTAYVAGSSAWLAQMGLASGGGLFRYAANYASDWTSVASGTFYSVWGSSPGDVYAAGDLGVFHAVDGGTFVGEGPDGGGALSLGGTGPTDIYAATSMVAGTILHSTGDGNWQAVYTETGGEAWAVWSGEPGDAYAIVVPVGGGDNPPAHLVHLKAGQGWVTESVSDTPTTLVTLWGSSAGDVYAGGWHLDSAGKGGDLFHSTGDGQWTRVALPGTPYDVRCVWGSSASDVYVGLYDIENGPVLLHGQP